jgi:protease PrsW
LDDTTTNPMTAAANSKQLVEPVVPTILAASGFRYARQIAWISGIIVMLALGLITLLMLSTETGFAALGRGIVIAMIPVPIYVMLLLWIDRYEREPGALLALAFLWGASVAAFLSYMVNTYISVHIAAVYGADAGPMVTALLASPLTEEIAKALAILIIYLWQRDEFDGVIDGIVYAGMVGLGFAMFENFLYYGKAAAAGKVEEVLVLRGFLSPFSHPLFTSMTGIGLGLARTTRNKALRYIYPLGGLLLAVILHFVWNYAATTGNLPNTYDRFMLPVFLGILGLVVFELKREGGILRTYLAPEAHSGFFSMEEYDQLCSVIGRVRKSWHALLKGGLRIWFYRSEYHHLASELAFLRSRVEREVPREPFTSAALESRYLDMLMELRDKLGPH